ncbi:unnamed protein product [Schistocephalus solidus]|uniref:Pancreatic hormone n=1 Tax=Schistocephalus solidus TaxID=70667 RepID=A0A183SD79_SCHSO|nr:unnamed protein product [Schistocephalus solidus]
MASFSSCPYTFACIALLMLGNKLTTALPVSEDVDFDDSVYDVRHMDRQDHPFYPSYTELLENLQKRFMLGLGVPPRSQVKKLFLGLGAPRRNRLSR